MILDRLEYCKKLSKMNRVDVESVNLSDIQDLKMKTIKDIHKNARLANLHYNNCHSQASKYINEDPKLKKITQMIQELDLTNYELTSY